MRRSPVCVFALGLSAASLTTLQAQGDVQARMQEWSKALGVECTGGISCNTCHQGKLTPPKITQAQWERDAKRHDAAFNGDTSLALQMGCSPPHSASAFRSVTTRTIGALTMDHTRR